MTTPKDNTITFPQVVDSSMRGEAVSCMHSFFRRYIQNWSKPGRSIHLHFGSAFAKGLEITRNHYYGEGTTPSVAVSKGLEAIIKTWGTAEFNHETKNLERCCGALEAYFAQYPLGTDHIQPARLSGGKLATEFSGAIPIPIKHPQTDEWLLYSGRFDMLAMMRDQHYVEDDKTTSQLGPTWNQQWRLRAQFTGYCFIAREFGYNPQGCIVRGISILKRSFGHAEVIEQRPRWMIDSWYHQLLRDVERMKLAWVENVWDQNLDSACASYGGCQFLDVCASREPDKWLEAGYEKVHYDPLGNVE